MQNEQRRTSDGSLVIGVAMLLGVGGAFLLGGVWRGIIGLLCLLVTTRALLAVWTLGFVPAHRRVAALGERANMYLLGVIGLICGLTLLVL